MLPSRRRRGGVSQSPILAKDGCGDASNMLPRGGEHNETITQTELLAKLALRISAMVHFDGFNGACGRLMFALLPVNAERAASVALGQIPMIQTRELGARIMRDQLADNEWTA